MYFATDVDIKVYIFTMTTTRTSYYVVLFSQGYWIKDIFLDKETLPLKIHFSSICLLTYSELFNLLLLL